MVHRTAIAKSLKELSSPKQEDSWYEFIFNIKMSVDHLYDYIFFIKSQQCICEPGKFKPSSSLPVIKTIKM